MPLNVQIFSDYVCPYCFLAEGPLNDAVAALDGEVGVEWMPFELRPHPTPTLEPDGGYLQNGWRDSVYPLAEKMGVPFVELDTEIEAEAGLTLSEIFALHGEGYYRRLEEQCLVHALSQHPTMVVALSGGFVQNDSAWQMVLERCQTVWLEAIPEDHMSRVLDQGDQRPTAGRENAMEELRAILAARAPRYAQSHHRFNTSSLGLEGAVHAISTALH